MAAQGDRSKSPRTAQSVHQSGLFRRSDSMAQVSQRLVEMLDHIEQRVELLREHAASMEQERDCLLNTIKTIQDNKELNSISEGEREEIQITSERLLARCLAVEIQVTTPRNEFQNEALQKVNSFVDELVAQARLDLEESLRRCQMYLNSCLPDTKGAICQKFQAVLIECTADDQKKTRKRLESLLKTLQHMTPNDPS